MGTETFLPLPAIDMVRGAPMVASGRRFVICWYGTRHL